MRSTRTVLAALLAATVFSAPVLAQDAGTLKKI